ncbi:hypothetical protein LTR37_015338 [Vermiconidia calcicola]|uniref:Uncharacterized protein n=1 Tax=Vermiconidia calcicola TaxID=1690605 RepID=A0ACC3MS66_9PEZI|nr:hypothetical protein LTR37_015338 [Vermiconidia calcicola]
MSPMAQVLETYELLEAIIANLPMHQIFVVERVSNTWNALISQSSKLQQLTFRRPAGDARTPCKRWIGHEYPYQTIPRYEGEYDANRTITRRERSCRMIPWENYMWVRFFNDKTGGDTFCKQTESRRAQYLTQPPTTTAMMGVNVVKYDGSVAERIDCTLHDPLG